MVVGCLGLHVKEDNWSPVIGFQKSTFLAPEHDIELDMLRSEVKDFTVDKFSVKVGLLSTVQIDNLKGEDF